jgi:hypothetical protein
VPPLVPFEDSLPIVAGCALAAVGGLVIWLRTAVRAWLVVALVAMVYGGAALAADLLVVTDREALQALFPRLARAAEAGDAETVLAAIDPQLRPLQVEAERALARAQATAILFTRLEIEVDPGRTPRTARADLIVRVTGRWVDGGSGTALVGLDVRLRKAEDRWLITAVQQVPLRPGRERPGR